MAASQSEGSFQPRPVNVSSDNTISGPDGQSISKERPTEENAQASHPTAVPLNGWSATHTTANVRPFKPSSTDKILEQFLAQRQGVMATANGSPQGMSSGMDAPNEPSATPVALTKADLKSTLATSLAPKSGVLPSQHPSQPMESSATQMSPGGGEAVESEEQRDRVDSIEDTIEAKALDVKEFQFAINGQEVQSASPSPSPNPMKPPLGRPPLSTKKVHTYVLPDGSVTHSGKGLGRGRPGIKRGPRKSKLSTEITAEPPPTFIPVAPAPPVTPTISTVPSAPVPTPTTPPTKKRKRSDASSSEEVVTHNSRSISSTPEYTPQSTQTRSGRQTQKPIAFLPTPSPSSTHPAPDTSISLATAAESAQKKTHIEFAKPHTPITHPKIKRKIYRGREALALCEHCLRGHGPTGNVIVFCDACNRCWHQGCHDPPINKEIVADKTAEWFCQECDEILHPTKKESKGRRGKKKKKSGRPSAVLASSPATTTPIAFVGTGPSNTPIAAAPAATANPTLVPTTSLTRDQRLAYLTSLSKDRLIDLVMRVSDLAPLLPLFEPPNTTTTSNPPPILPQKQQNQSPFTPTAPSTTPTTSVATKYEPSHSSSSAVVDDDYWPVEEEGEEWEYLLDETARLYPKPGRGVQLPPESVDMHLLLEGPECRTFSHWVAGSAGGMPVSA